MKTLKLNSIKSVLVATLLGIGFTAMNFEVPLAAAGDGWKRFQICKQMRQSGELNWVSIATGVVSDGLGRNGNSGFHIKTCHNSERSCQQWIRNIGYEIPHLDFVRTAFCQPAN